MKESKNVIVVEATNIRGQGALAVCQNLIPAIIQDSLKLDCSIQLRLSYELYERLEDVLGRFPKIRFSFYKKSFFNELMRILSYFCRYKLRPNDLLIVMGDLPFKTISSQTVFVQQAHLISPSIEENVGKGFKFQLMRLLFRRNLRYADRFIVQTNYMKSSLVQSYGMDPSKVVVRLHPVPRREEKSFDNSTTRLWENHEEKVYFYPSSSYAHKNHKVLWQALPLIVERGLKVRFVLTLHSADAPEDVRTSPYLTFLGTITSQECTEWYRKSDALIFPSLLESYGLPLLESLLNSKKPALVSNRPFTREICGKLAHYFDPKDPTDLVNKIEAMLKSWPNIHENDLESLPELVDWDMLAKEYLIKVKCR